MATRNNRSRGTKNESKFRRTLEEQELVHAYDQQRGIPGVKREGAEGSGKITPKMDDHALWAAQIADLTKIYNPLAMDEVLVPLANVAFKTSPEKAFNSGLGLLKAIAPKDGIEGLLTVQMIASHRIGLEMARRALVPEQTMEGCESAIKRSTQMMRLFTKQLEALHAYRGKTSKQEVTVEHVHVHKGGQAIVGNVAHGGRVQQPEGRKPHAKAMLTHAPEPTVQCKDAAADALPISGDVKRSL